MASKKETPFQYHTFPNGLRLIHKTQANNIAHLALMINAGARDESENQHGLAHMIEHMLFKGTIKRKAYHIISRLENVGCDLNAFTTKEETCLHATFLPTYYDRTAELFADVCFHSVFPAHELAKEKEVILDEIHAYRDNPSEEIVDEFENQLFKNHQLGHHILGSNESVQLIQRENLLQFVSMFYQPEQMVISSVGRIKFDKLIKLIGKHFGEISSVPRASNRNQVVHYQPSTILLKKENYLSHAFTGNLAYAFSDARKISMVMLNNILGGPGLNSRLNLNIREKYGIAYSIDSQYTAYSDTGWFGVYIGTDDESLEKALKLVNKELSALRNNTMGTLQLARAKQQLIVQLAISNESGLHEALGMARSLLVQEQVETTEQINAQIIDISARQLQEIANEVFDPSQLSTLIFQSGGK